MELATIIVNYRSSSLAADCLRSLALEAPGLVVVVDNASPDDSVQVLNDEIRNNQWSDWCHLIAAGHNGGYAAGNNVGLRWLQQANFSPDYFLFLNPDTTVRPGAIRALIQFMRDHPKVGIAGSRLEDLDGKPQRSAFRFPGVLSELESALRLGFVTKILAGSMVAPPVRDTAHATDWVAGASMIVRKQVVEQIGFMDEGYFLYFEEVDYCLKARRAGWPCWYVPTSRVVHLVGQSTGVTNSRSTAQRIPEYWLASRQRYFRKNHTAINARLADAAWAGGFALWRLRRRLQRKPDTDPPRLLADFMRFNFGLGWRKSA